MIWQFGAVAYAQGPASSGDAKPEASGKPAELAITVQPEDQEAMAGEEVTFVVQAAGEALSYQWQKGVPGPQADHTFDRNTALDEEFVWTALDGENAPEYTFTVNLEDLYDHVYRCIVTSGEKELATRSAKVQEPANQLLRAAASAPTVEYGDIYANGVTIEIVAGSTSGFTNILYNKDGKNEYLQIGADAPTAAGYDLSSYTVYGGSNQRALTGSTNITMTGGKVAEIYGGSFQNVLTGSTRITMTGGEVRRIYGGSSGGEGVEASVTGDTHVTVNGGTVSSKLYGGGYGRNQSGEHSVVAGTASVAIGENASVKSAFGGGDSGTVTGSTELILSGGTVETVTGGSYISGKVTDNISLKMTGGEVTGNLWDNEAMSPAASAAVSLTGGKVGGSVKLNNIGESSTTSLTVGGGMKIGDGNTEGIQIKKGISFAIASGLTNESSLTVILPNGFDASANPAIATGAVEADLAKITLAGPGAVGKEAYFESGSIRVKEIPTYGVTLDKTDTHTFDSAIVGYREQTPLTVQVTNTGNQPTGALTVALSGANAGSFTLSKTNLESIARDGSASFTVKPNTGLAAGTYTAEVTVSGGKSISASFNVSFTVANKSSDATLSALDYTVGGGQATAVPGFSANQEHYSVSLPSGTAQDAAITLSGTPKDSQARITENNGVTLVGGSGTATIEVTAEDGTTVKTYTVDFSIKTDVPTSAAPSIITASLPDGTEGTAYSAALTATGASPIVWSLSSGSLPNGLTLSHNGTITGTPAEAGTFHFTIKAANGVQPDATRALAIVIEPLPAYTITASAGRGGTISPSEAVTVKEGKHQTFTITPSRNYRIASVLVDGIDQGAVNTWTFENVTENHSISVTFRYIGDDDDISGSGDSDVSLDVTVQPPTETDKLTIGVAPALTPDNDGKVLVEDEIVSAAIFAARLDARRTGSPEGDIAVSVLVDTTWEQSALDITLAASALDKLVEEQVSRLDLSTQDMASFSLTQDTLEQLDADSSGGQIILRTEKQTELAETARAVVAFRPAYDISVLYLENGREIPIATLNGQTITIKLPYIPRAGEDMANLYAVYVDDAGEVHWLTDSAYDISQKAMLAQVSHFSIYGVGYKPDAAFTDTAGHWAKADIDFVSQRGLIDGTSTSTFSPNADITRAMLVTALGRLAGIDPAAYPSSNQFTDVSAAAYYAPYVEWAASNGIIKEAAEQTFAPNAAITREQLAAMMHQYAKAQGAAIAVSHEAQRFADADQITDGMKDAVEVMQQAGIMNGKGGQRFAPNDVATRAEAAAVLHRFVELVRAQSTH